MPSIDPIPSEDAIDDIRDQWSERTDAFGRVYTTAIGITEYTRYNQIAETADCAPNTAKKHLERLVDMGIVERSPNVHVARYRRNDSYFEWREASRIADNLTIDEIIERVQNLESQREEFEERFGAEDPDSVSVFDQDDHEAIHEQMAAVSQWQSIERDIQLYELARQLAHNDGHLIPQ
ncbi:sugar-specific transcriptional regulator TrmB [Halogeometricum sp. CBA1124]|uniref:DUF7342 family protein n=1 Tax=Halogeometricum sp. CBA1124 TaxID=2668071 RepID=UPI001429E29A|nr:sugar-specific transcriptional regulator TrmB [Halogeometricum sp. CBA1124]MUV58274.1 sugar-specific transcriptional regulator TrmB [Halogeometricum sp. CBA1124]